MIPFLIGMLCISIVGICSAVIYALGQIKLRVNDKEVITYRVLLIVGSVFLTALSLTVLLLLIVFFRDVYSFSSFAPLYIFWIFLLFVSIVDILLGVNWKLEVREDYLLYQNMFRITKRIPYEEIIHFDISRLKNRQIYLFIIRTKKVTIVIPNKVYNFLNIDRYVRDRLEAHNCDIDDVVREMSAEQ